MCVCVKSESVGHSVISQLLGPFLKGTRPIGIREKGKQRQTPLFRAPLLGILLTLWFVVKSLGCV